MGRPKQNKEEKDDELDQNFQDQDQSIEDTQNSQNSIENPNNQDQGEDEVKKDEENMASPQLLEGQVATPVESFSLQLTQADKDELIYLTDLTLENLRGYIGFTSSDIARVHDFLKKMETCLK